MQLLVCFTQLPALQQRPTFVPSQRARHVPPSHEIPGPHEEFLQTAVPSSALVRSPLLHEPEPVQRMTALVPATAVVCSFAHVPWS